jgi:hypothetical protein
MQPRHLLHRHREQAERHVSRRSAFVVKGNFAMSCGTRKSSGCTDGASQRARRWATFA